MIADIHSSETMIADVPVHTARPSVALPSRPPPARKSIHATPRRVPSTASSPSSSGRVPSQTFTPARHASGRGIWISARTLGLVLVLFLTTLVLAPLPADAVRPHTRAYLTRRAHMHKLIADPQATPWKREPLIESAVNLKGGISPRSTRAGAQPAPTFTPRKHGAIHTHPHHAGRLPHHQMRADPATALENLQKGLGL